MNRCKLYGPLLLLLWTATSLNIQSQEINLEGHQCATEILYEYQKQQDPAVGERVTQMREKVREHIARKKAGGRLKTSSKEVYTIPVVVHVIWKDSIHNLSFEQIQSQIDVLNEDFRRNNADTTNTNALYKDDAGDAYIQFCLAQRTPLGCSTNGVTRTKTNKSSFSFMGDDAKFDDTGGKNAWPTRDYLNIWVVPELDGGLVLGYAQFPGQGTENTDGVVVIYDAFGRGSEYKFRNGQDKGRTTVHEVGHWLDLRHTWGDGSCTADDGIDDTPNCDGQNFSSYPNCPAPTECGNVRQIENYMDYSQDGCQNTFTHGQVDVMRGVLETASSRSKILDSKGCMPPEPEHSELVEGFEDMDNPFPPEEWHTTQKGMLSWVHTIEAGGFDKSTSAARLPIYTSGNEGDRAALYALPFDLSNAKPPVKLTFSLAHARYGPDNLDTLLVVATTDCHTWDTIWIKWGNQLGTVPWYDSAAFVPEASNHWRQESVALNAYLGESSLVVGFIGASAGGNHIYIDDVNIHHAKTHVPPSPRLDTGLKVYPNPSTHWVHIKVGGGNVTPVSAALYNMVGEFIREVSFDARHRADMAVSDLAAGVYLLKVVTDAGVDTRKITIAR